MLIPYRYCARMQYIKKILLFVFYFYIEFLTETVPEYLCRLNLELFYCRVPYSYCARTLTVKQLSCRNWKKYYFAFWLSFVKICSRRRSIYGHWYFQTRYADSVAKTDWSILSEGVGVLLIWNFNFCVWAKTDTRVLLKIDCRLEKVSFCGCLPLTAGVMSQLCFLLFTVGHLIYLIWVN